MNRDSLPGPVVRHPAIATLLVALSIFFLFGWSSPHGAANRQNSSSSSIDLSPFAHSEVLPHR
jgi:hypothetical protein